MLLVVKEVLHFHCKVCKRFGIFYFNVSKISNITKRVPLIQFRQPPNLGKWRNRRKRAIITSQPFHFLRSCIPNTRTRSPLYSSTCVNFVAEIVLMFPRKKKKMSFMRRRMKRGRSSIRLHLSPSLSLRRRWPRLLKALWSFSAAARGSPSSKTIVSLHWSRNFQNEAQAFFHPQIITWKCSFESSADNHNGFLGWS